MFFRVFLVLFFCAFASLGAQVSLLVARRARIPELRRRALALEAWDPEAQRLRGRAPGWIGTLLGRMCDDQQAVQPLFPSPLPHAPRAVLASTRAFACAGSP